MADTLMSSCALLRRNWPDFPFGSGMDDAQRQGCVERVAKALDEMDDTFYLYQAAGVDESLLQGFCFEHFPGDDPGENRRASVMLQKGERLALVINAEDHLLFCGRSAGGDVGDAAERVLGMARTVSAARAYACRSGFGFLTARPLYAGTGLHLCFTLHLPLLGMLQQLRSLEAALAKEQRFTLKAFGGADGKNPGSLFALFNEKTLYADEESLISAARAAVAWLETKELELRKKIFNGNHRTVYADQVFRAYGVLRYARRLGAVEFLSLWSKLRLGAAAGVLPLSVQDADRMLDRSRKSQLLRDVDGQAGEKALNFLRADMVRDELNGGA